MGCPRKPAGLGLSARETHFHPIHLCQVYSFKMLHYNYLSLFWDHSEQSVAGNVNILGASSDRVSFASFYCLILVVLLT